MFLKKLNLPKLPQFFDNGFLKFSQPRIDIFNFFIIFIIKKLVQSTIFVNIPLNFYSHSRIIHNKRSLFNVLK